MIQGMASMVLLTKALNYTISLRGFGAVLSARGVGVQGLIHG